MFENHNKKPYQLPGHLIIFSLIISQDIFFISTVISKIQIFPTGHITEKPQKLQQQKN